MTSRLPIRWRLTLWYVALLALALAIFSGVFYFGLRHLLLDSLESTLENQAALIENAVTVTDGDLSLSANRADRSDDDQFVRLVHASGNVVVDSSDEFDAPPDDPEGVAAALDGRTVVRWIDSEDDRMRILSRPISRDGQIIGALQLGIESDIDDTLGFALQLIAIAVPLILLFAAGGGFWLAGRALEPVDRITRTAAGIEERDLSRRIDLTLPDDEVGRLASTFNAMLDRIEGAFGRQRQFTADAAHELRTPLALMRSQIDLAVAQPRDPGRDYEILTALGADVDRLTRLAAALLSLARSDAYGIALVREPVHLPEILELITEQYAPLAANEGVEIVVDDEPASLNADEDQLIQVLVNLVDNALRHARPGTRITLGCRQEHGSVRLWVADQGPGIAPEHLPHLFDRFYRIEPGRDRRQGGLGLGLSISQAIVHAHGGEIDVESTVGQGTTVTVVLPQAE